MRVSLEPPVDPATYRFCHQLRVRFAETDAMGVVHHAAYLLYLEAARVEYLRWAGRPYHQLRREGIEFPVVEVAIRYLRPLRFDDLVDVHALVAATRGATFQIGYLLTTGEGTEPVATAVTVHGATRAGLPVRCPDWLRSLAGTG